MTTPTTNQTSTQQGSYNYKYSPYSLSYGDKADLLEKIKPEHIVYFFQHYLQGEQFVNGEWIDDPEMKPYSLSKIGATKIATLMLSASSQNVALSNLNDDEIRLRAAEVTKTAIKLCLRNYKAWGIKGRDTLALVKEIVFGNTYASLKQCQNEGIRALLKGTVSEIKSTSDQANEGGLLANLFRRNKKS